MASIDSLHHLVKSETRKSFPSVALPEDNHYVKLFTMTFWREFSLFCPIMVFKRGLEITPTIKIFWDLSHLNN